MSKQKPIQQRIAHFMGEIIVIVIGVSLTFMVSNWREASMDRKKADKLLTEIQHNLERDSLLFSRQIEKFKKRVVWGKKLIYLHDPESMKDSLVHHLYSLLEYTPFTPVKTGYLQLEQMDGFQLVEDKELLSEIITVYASNYTFIEHLARNHEHYLNEQILPYVNNNFPFINSRLEDLQEEDRNLFMQSIQSHKFRNKVIFYVQLMENALLVYELTQDKVTPLLKKLAKR